MTQILEPITCSTPARRRAHLAVPVLIRVPALGGTPVGGVRSPGRRRLRREIRVAGCWLLALIPPTVACATWGSGRPAVLLAISTPDRSAATERVRGATRPSSISLSLEPAHPAQPTQDIAVGSVFLSGQILPADSAEESTHGGY